MGYGQVTPSTTTLHVFGFFRFGPGGKTSCVAQTLHNSCISGVAFDTASVLVGSSLASKVRVLAGSIFISIVGSAGGTSALNGTQLKFRMFPGCGTCSRVALMRRAPDDISVSLLSWFFLQDLT